MNWMLLYKYLFLLGVAIIIYMGALQKPALTPLFSSDLMQSLRYGGQVNIRLKPAYVAIAVFGGLCAALFIFWLMFVVNPEVLRIIYAADTGIVLSLLVHSSGILNVNRSKKFRLCVIAISGLIFGLLGLVWILVPIWIVYDLLAILLGYVMLSQLGKIRLRYVAALMIAISMYDLWGVWGSAVIVGGSGMIGDIAFGMTYSPPGIVMVPENIFSPLASIVGRLGVGDIVIPGIAILSASWMRLEKEAILGFALGLLATFLLLVVVQRPVPATITLNPVMLLTIFISARIRGIKIEW